jgi:hypothetical protein
MKSFSLIGVGLQLPKPGISGSLGVQTHNGKSSRYVDPRRSKEQYAALQRQGSANPKRLRSMTHPPARPVVRLAKERDNVHFRTLILLCGVAANMTPHQVEKVIRDEVWRIKEDGVLLHRCVSNCVIIRLTLKTRSGYSRFEGTTAQLLESFRPLARAAQA